MNLIQYNSMILRIFCLLSIIVAKEVKPIDSQPAETLKIYSKDRDYYNLFGENLVYNIEGPCVLHIYSRLAFPELTKKPKPYQFSVKLTSEEFTDTLIIDNHFREDPNVSSLEHPKYSYTSSGKDVINVPKGKHIIELSTTDNKSKVLVRVISRPFKSNRKIDNPILNMKNDIDKMILKKNNDENIQYFSLVAEDMKNKLFFDIEGPQVIKILSRTSVLNSDKRQYYQFKVRQDGKLIATYHMFAQKSNYWRLLLPDKKTGDAVSVSRTSYINVPKGSHDYEIELVSPKQKNIFFRIKQEK